MNTQTKNSLLLLLCSLIWGTAFVAQSAGSGMGAYSFLAGRSWLAVLVLIPTVMVFDAIRRKSGTDAKPKTAAEKKKLLADAIVCCGQNSMAIVVLHFLCFKIISLVGVVVYNQPRERIAAFPVLYEHGAWWVTYMFAGIIVPVLLSVMWKKLKGK